MDRTDSRAVDHSASVSEAEASCRAAVRAAPRDALAWHQLGSLLFKQRRSEAAAVAEAAEALRRATELAPAVAAFHGNLAAVLGVLGRHEEAAVAAAQAVRLEPTFVEARLNLGVALERLGRLPEMVEAYRAALEHKPDHPPALLKLGHALRRVDKPSEAVGVFRRFVELCPSEWTGHAGLAAALNEVGDLAAGLACSRRAVEAGAPAADHSALILAMQYDSSTPPEAVYEEAIRWAARHAPVPAQPEPHTNEALPDRRLRVGYLSPDFRNHPVGRLLEPILRKHDRRQVEVVCYSDSATTDAVTTHLRAMADRWRNIADRTDEDVERMIRDDGIDVLIETSGHFAGNRLTLMVRRPAPVQVSALGYCGTTGIRGIDYRLTDVHSDPPGMTEHLHTESLLRLDDRCWVFRPFDETPPVRPLPALTKGRVTFGCLNNAAKLSDATLACWGRLLQRVPSAQLLLLARRTAAETLSRRLREAQLDASRVSFMPPGSRQTYLEAYHQIDVALDPFPFNGDNTTADAMWMGVPVVSLAGRSFAARRGLSHLTNVGLGHLAVLTTDAYVDQAVRLTDDLQNLAAVRRSMRDRVIRSPLGDSAQFVIQLESTYRAAWQTWCSRKP